MLRALVVAALGVAAAAPTGTTSLLASLNTAELTGTVQDPAGNQVPKEQWLKDQLRAMLGREPNMEELSAARGNMGGGPSSEGQKAAEPVKPGLKELTGSIQNPNGDLVSKETWLREQLRSMLGHEPSHDELIAARANFEGSKAGQN
jgi:hypothetical protein